MDLRAMQVALAGIVNPFVTCHDNIPANTDFPCAYVGLPTLIQLNTTLGGSHIVSMPVTLCLSRVDDDVAQVKLTEILSSGLLDALDTATSPAWKYAQFLSVDKFRTVKFAGGDVEVIACDLNTIVSS